MADSTSSDALESEDVEHPLDEWSALEADERYASFGAMPRDEAEELFLMLDSRDQAELIQLMPMNDQRSWMRLLAPDDAADLIQEAPSGDREDLIAKLDRVTRREVSALLAYEEDEAGGLMSPRYARVRPDMTVDEGLTYLRRQARRQIETIAYAYVLDEDQHLLGVISLRELFVMEGQRRISEVMVTDLISVTETTNQEEASRLLSQNGLLALPVVDNENHLKGIITVDDVIEVIEEENTEDIQKIGGMEALGAPYLEIGFFEMIRKRAGWLSVLFAGEMLTATAMGYYEDEIAKAVVLVLFIPLIISSGGNSGSQAATLVIRAMALGEVRTRQWARVLRREIASGLVLGVILGSMGMIRVVLWPNSVKVYGEHYVLIGFTVAASLMGVVLWGTIAGSMLPILLKRLGFDPASGSAPFVATLVDVTGLIIYFTMASALLGGLLL